MSSIKYTKNFVTSKDGTEIGYRQFGKGAGLILVHGGMMAAQNLMKLGELLADEFTVYIPDRQGRGLSATHENFGLRAESEDLLALVNQTNAENIYGLSAGAIITLQAALIEKRIKRIVLHEPPILTSPKTIVWANQYKAAMKNGNYGKAFISIVKGTDDPSSLFNILPGFITAPLMNIAIKYEAKKIKENGDDVLLKDLITAMPYDIKVVQDSFGIIEKAKNLTIAILLLKGQKSQPYLKTSIDDLSIALPNAKCTELLGQGHTVSDNNGSPELVAVKLKDFFMKNDCK